MRILFFANNYPTPLQPGRGAFNREMVRALNRHHDVRVVCPVPWTEELSARVKQGQKLDRNAVTSSTGVAADYPRFLYPPFVLRSFYGQFMWHSVRRRLLSIADRFAPDVVLSYWAHPDGEVAVRLARRLNIPSAVMLGGSDILLLTQNRARRRVILDVLRNADAVVPVSEHIAERVRDFGIANSKTHVVYRGVDREVFTASNRDAARMRLGIDRDVNAIVAVGRLVPVKGFDVLIDAVARLRNRGNPLTCHIIGNGPLFSQLTQQIRERRLDGRVVLHGSRDHSELAEWYRAADATVLTSHSEGIPNVLLESIACGTPFVASRVGGIPEIADLNHDVLVPAGNIEALADALETRLKSETLHQPRHFEPGTWDDSAAQLTAVIDKCRKSDPTSPFEPANRPAPEDRHHINEPTPDSTLHP